MCESLRCEIEDFLYHEAALLDERRWEEWLQLFTDDALYVMPVRQTKYSSNSKALASLKPAEDADDVLRQGELAYFDDTLETLRMRAQRLSSGMAWAEEPPSRTRRFIANVRVVDQSEESDPRQQALAHSNFMLYRARLETEEDFWIGCRDDILRKVDGQWRIAHRTILLDKTVLQSSLSLFF
jgi:3-phenylpropionate/cinnamic acid dioxygenase small subunit